MRIVLDTERVSLAGIQRIGDSIELPEREARALVEDGQAHIETTVNEQKREKATTRLGRGR